MKILSVFGARQGFKKVALMQRVVCQIYAVFQPKTDIEIADRSPAYV